MSNPLISARWYALRDIDEAAGRARLRFITDVPGQQAVYMLKLQQATAYLQALSKSPAAAVPPYIAAESAATGQTPRQVADLVVTLSATWNDEAGPAIEGLRMGGKAAVYAAVTLGAIESAKTSAIQALDAFGT